MKDLDQIMGAMFFTTMALALGFILLYPKVGLGFFSAAMLILLGGLSGMYKEKPSE